MSNIKQDFEVFKPHITMQWAKDTVVRTDVIKNDDGRFVCRVKVNSDEFFSLPGAHPTEADAKLTLEAYVKEYSYEECKCGCNGDPVEHQKWQDEVKAHRQWVQAKIEEGEF